jgi:S1-C subfamily serine protease
MRVLTASAVKHVSARLPGRLTLAFLLASLTPAGCTRYVGVDSGLGPQAYYRTGFPVSDVSGALERVTASVVMIFVQRTYETYLFAEDNAPTAGQLQSPGSDVRVLAVDTISSRETMASTGVVIASLPRKLTILATDHATHFPDTIVNYFDTEGSGAIERISIKTQQTNTISTLEYVDPFEILARNQAEDLSLIGVTFTNDVASSDRPPARLATGDPGRLSLGSLVYVIGNSAGRQVVTHGIVSERRGRDDSFLTDGLWNEGMSGAPILAVRGLGGGLEWVGIALAASASTEYRLVAKEGAERTQDPLRPYEGLLYLQPVQEIRYGITFSVPLTVIHRFLNEHGSLARDLGYPLP